MNLKALVSEFIGTFALIFFGVGSVAASPHNLVGVALAHGLIIAVMASAVGAISGGHFNPSISFGAWIGHRLSTKNLFFYWLVQLAGAAVGAWLIIFCIPDVAGTPQRADEITMAQAFVLEAIGAFFLTFVVYGTAIDKRAPKVGAIFIGLTITVAILCFGPQTGASINPARFFGPALAEHKITQMGAMIYIIAPLLGGGLAGAIYNYFLAEKEPGEPVSSLAP